MNALWLFLPIQGYLIAFSKVGLNGFLTACEYTFVKFYVSWLVVLIGMIFIYTSPLSILYWLYNTFKAHRKTSPLVMIHILLGLIASSFMAFFIAVGQI
jgi:hypothetical protein